MLLIIPIGNELKCVLVDDVKWSRKHCLTKLDWRYVPYVSNCSKY